MPTSTFSTEVLQQLAIIVEDPPKVIDEATFGAGHLDGDRFGCRLLFADLWAKNTMPHPGVIQHQTILLIGIQAQTTADDLLIQTNRFRWAQDRDHIDMCCVESGGQHRDVHQIFKRFLLKIMHDLVALTQLGGSYDQPCLSRRQVIHDLLRMFHR